MALPSIDSSMETVGFIGLGAVASTMANRLTQGGRYSVWGFDVDASSMSQFAVHGGRVDSSPKLVAERSRFLVCTVASEKEVSNVLFNAETGALTGQQDKTKAPRCGK